MIRNLDDLGGDHVVLEESLQCIFGGRAGDYGDALARQIVERAQAGPRRGHEAAARDVVEVGEVHVLLPRERRRRHTTDDVHLTLRHLFEAVLRSDGDEVEYE